MVYSPFHEPTDFGTFDLSTSQVGKVFSFNWDADVIANAKVVAVHNNKAMKTYTVGDGLVISEANRAISVTVDGSDYTNLTGRSLVFNCNFFVLGDIEVTFKLNIIKSQL